MGTWSLDDIAWQEFDSSKVRPELVCVIKAACMVEHNGYDYARYLCEVFSDDKEFQRVAHEWAEEEVQHGRALRKWAELADPSFDFDKSFEIFTTGYKLPVNVDASVRGSKSGELIARCVVETGTSSYYTAIKDATSEPVLKSICAKIAADEFRHYKLFYTHLTSYLEKENIGFWKRLRVAMSRITESEDDELAYAFFAANHSTQDYNHKFFTKTYMSHAYRLYKREHVERMTAMVFKAVGLTPNTRLNRTVNGVMWNVMQLRAHRLRRYAEPALAAA